MAKVKGYKVVGIDARPEPIELAKQLKYPPDLLLNAGETKAEDARKKVAELDKEKPFDGVDGKLAYRVDPIRWKLKHGFVSRHPLG